jgi:hypothetical protein
MTIAKEPWAWTIVHDDGRTDLYREHSNAAHAQDNSPSPVQLVPLYPRPTCSTCINYDQERYARYTCCRYAGMPPSQYRPTWDDAGCKWSCPDHEGRES